ncbi:unnamed protein product [Didymodactylos carnosus]|uniref:DUF2252 domain-containing protein n=1 Tax=Didymodactylos carnosus TaxID=1234261 RepID=A0A814HN89_9BILA|nr:unnamed protein product [Didymodactylos carnosus]CAF3783768.1 unnamed protein product [Didymodactylos carnosus]
MVQSNNNSSIPSKCQYSSYVFLRKVNEQEFRDTVFIKRKTERPFLIPSPVSGIIRQQFSTVEFIQNQTSEQRSQHIIDIFEKYFGENIRKNPRTWNGRFRTMAQTSYAFYRGSAILFYQDLKQHNDQWVKNNPAASNIFLHGDLHAENFGIYLNSNGILNFDVNNFNEGYYGPFTWDLKRLITSLNLILYAKGFSDLQIEAILFVCVGEYLKQVYEFCKQEKNYFALTLQNTKGEIYELLQRTKIKSHAHHLDNLTHIKDYERKFIRNKTIKDVDEQLYEKILDAFQQYLNTISENKHHNKMTYSVKDIVKCQHSGNGIVDKLSYNILIQGDTEIVESDTILYMKPAQKSVISFTLKNEQFEKNYLKHDGLRTVLCSYAMQANVPKWIGYTTLDNTPYVIDEISAYVAELDWSDINHYEDIIEIVKYLGKATAKIHCVSDSDCKHTLKHASRLPVEIIPQHTEVTICDAVRGRDIEFIHSIVDFGMAYGELTRRDHHLFFEAFRKNKIHGL